jgi:hypothetical protein
MRLLKKEETATGSEATALQPAESVSAPASGLESWQVRVDDFPADGERAEQLYFLLHYAVLAPSSHNTQPWLFTVGDDGVELHADRTRALAVVDPEDRELTISCGAALLNLRLALRRFGYEEMVTPLPDGASGDLLARTTVRPNWVPSAEERALFAAIPERHTSRRPFAARDVPPVLLAALEGEADDEGAWLHVVTDPEAKRDLAELIAGAEKMLWDDRRYRRELTTWTHPRRSRRGDGIPGYAQGLADLHTFLAPFADPAARETGEVGSSLPTSDAEVAPDGGPALVVLGTDEDAPHAWLAAGQALERVLLRAQVDGVSASFLNQPIEVVELRPKLREQLQRRGHPQLILRLGYGPESRPTPRRLLHEVLL